MVVDRINTFAKTYEISFEELLIQDPKGYKYVAPKLRSFLLSDFALSRTFNEFFYRRLKPSARPPASPTDPSIICSSADCRLVVFSDVTAARTFWCVRYSGLVPCSHAPRIKGKSFTIPLLLGSPTLARRFTPLSSLAVFRLAPQVCLARIFSHVRTYGRPQDYHRFHSPVDGTIESVTTVRL